LADTGVTFRLITHSDRDPGPGSQDEAHAKWGESDEALLAGCLAEALSLPVNGAPISSGNFLECRAGACARAEFNALACRDAMGVVSCR
jgi:hypothetical protein